MSVESTLKILEYIDKVAKEPILLNGEPFGTPPVEKVVLNESFFWKDDCHMCGKCCPNETTVWTSEGMIRVLNATPEDFTVWGLDPLVVSEITGRVFEHVVFINHKRVTFYVSEKDKASEAFRLAWPDRKEQQRCHWLFEKDGTYRCRIHPVRSVTCGMPHCRFFHNAKTHNTTIGVSQFGRNWALKCPVEFGPVDESSVQTRILWLERLYATAKDCGIDTFLPEILDYLHSGNRSPAVFECKPKKKLFTVR
jgi:Fe-S-cluster containining protein